MSWVLGILVGVVLLYVAFVVVCYLYWNFKVVHRYSDEEEELFLTKDGNAYSGNLTFRGMIFMRPFCVAKNLKWKGVTSVQIDGLIYDKCIDDHLDLLGPRSYDWMEEDGLYNT